ncbi:MAG: hypothetical protein ACJAX6_000441, partial [Limisphaerales bacterium]
MIFAAGMAMAGPGQDDGDGHADGGLEFALKPKGLGQAGQFQFS